MCPGRLETRRKPKKDGDEEDDAELWGLDTRTGAELETETRGGRREGE
jgi:hypothetical protein